MDYTFLPTPLAISLDRVRDSKGNPELDPWGGATFEATSPTYPELSGRSSSADEATQHLLEAVMYALPLAREVTDALQAAGYPLEVVTAWERETKDCADRSYRHSADLAVATLNDYTTSGIPALTACGFVPLLPLADAVAVHIAGCGPQDVREYARMAESSRWWDVDFDIMSWLLAGLPASRGHLYVDHCAVEEAVEWEAFIEGFPVSDDDLRSLVRAHIRPQDVARGFPVRRGAFYAEHSSPRIDAVAWEGFATRYGVADDNLVGLTALFAEPGTVVPGFPLHRAAFYAACRTPINLVLRWEDVLSEYGQPVDDSDLCDILSAELEPECLLECAATSDDAGFDLGQAARALMGLRPR